MVRRAIKVIAVVVSILVIGVALAITLPLVLRKSNDDASPEPPIEPPQGHDPPIEPPQGQDPPTPAPVLNFAQDFKSLLQDTCFLKDTTKDFNIGIAVENTEDPVDLYCPETNIHLHTFEYPYENTHLTLRISSSCDHLQLRQGDVYTDIQIMSTGISGWPEELIFGARFDLSFDTDVCKKQFDLYLDNQLYDTIYTSQEFQGETLVYEVLSGENIIDTITAKVQEVASITADEAYEIAGSRKFELTNFDINPSTSTIQGWTQLVYIIDENDVSRDALLLIENDKTATLEFSEMSGFVFDAGIFQVRISESLNFDINILPAPDTYLLLPCENEVCSPEEFSINEGSPFEFKLQKDVVLPDGYMTNIKGGLNVDLDIGLEESITLTAGDYLACVKNAQGEIIEETCMDINVMEVLAQFDQAFRYDVENTCLFGETDMIVKVTDPLERDLKIIGFDNDGIMSALLDYDHESDLIIDAYEYSRLEISRSDTPSTHDILNIKKIVLNYNTNLYFGEKLNVLISSTCNNSETEQFVTINDEETNEHLVGSFSAYDISIKYLIYNKYTNEYNTVINRELRTSPVTDISRGNGSGLHTNAVCFSVTVTNIQITVDNTRVQVSNQVFLNKITTDITGGGSFSPDIRFDEDGNFIAFVTSGTRFNNNEYTFRLPNNIRFKIDLPFKECIRP